MLKYADLHSSVSGSAGQPLGDGVAEGSAGAAFRPVVHGSRPATST